MTLTMANVQKAKASEEQSLSQSLSLAVSHDSI